MSRKQVLIDVKEEKERRKSSCFTQHIPIFAFSYTKKIQQGLVAFKYHSYNQEILFVVTDLQTDVKYFMIRYHFSL